MAAKREYITDFIGLDLLRFILALVVVVRHYYHFYGPFPDSQFNGFGTTMTAEPLYALLSPLYNLGHLAVPMFWLISGLIFYSIYHSEIINNEISFGKFSFLRFTRLYPLHFLTLLIVVAIQSFYYYQHGSYFVYQENTLARFFLQIFFMDSWQATGINAFNIPAWSVSVEIFVYMVFFFVTSAGLTKGKGLPIMLLLFMVINFFPILIPFRECLLFFFSGCLLARWINSGVPLTTLFMRSVVGTVVFLVGTRLLKPYILPMESLNYVVYLLKQMSVFVVVVLCFIITFRSVTSKFMMSTFKNLGNMTYSIYLVHFPIQICFFMVISAQDSTVFNNPNILYAFLVTSTAVGWLAYRYFEKPVQRYLRAKFNQPTGMDAIESPELDELADNVALEASRK